MYVLYFLFVSFYAFAYMKTRNGPVLLPELSYMHMYSSRIIVKHANNGFADQPAYKCRLFSQAVVRGEIIQIVLDEYRLYSTPT